MDVHKSFWFSLIPIHWTFGASDRTVPGMIHHRQNDDSIAGRSHTALHHVDAWHVSVNVTSIAIIEACCHKFIIVTQRLVIPKCNPDAYLMHARFGEYTQCMLHTEDWYTSAGLSLVITSKYCFLLLVDYYPPCLWYEPTSICTAAEVWVSCLDCTLKDASLCTSSEA